MMCPIATCLRGGDIPVTIHFGEEQMFTKMCNVHVKVLYLAEAEVKNGA